MNNQFIIEWDLLQTFNKFSKLCGPRKHCVEHSPRNGRRNKDRKRHFKTKLGEIKNNILQTQRPATGTGSPDIH